jgi:hypothetical protein
MILIHLVSISIDNYNKARRKHELDLAWECETINGVPTLWRHEIINGDPRFPFKRVSQSATQLHRMIQKNGYPDADYKTVRKYLKDMVAKQDLEIVPGKRHRNQSAYRVSRNKMTERISHLDEARQQLALTNPRILDYFLLPIIQVKNPPIRVSESKESTFVFHKPLLYLWSYLPLPNRYSVESNIYSYSRGIVYRVS